MTFLNNFFAIVGIITLGALGNNVLYYVTYYLANKSWPKHPLVLERENSEEVASVRIEALEKENQNLILKLDKANNELDTIWLRTINKIN